MTKYMTRDYTSLDVSKRLQEIGFKAETDKYWVESVWRGEDGYTGDFYLRDYNNEERLKENRDGHYYPAYSCQTLLDALPEFIDEDNRNYLEIFKCNNTNMVVCYYETSVMFNSDTIVEALGQILIYILENKLTPSTLS